MNSRVAAPIPASDLPIGEDSVTSTASQRYGVPIGRYTFVREIATGGMATVFLARVQRDGVEREVAIKRLHPHLAMEEEFVGMFFDEAKLAARIHHPNVVTILDVDDIEGLSLVMDYIEGPTLLELARHQSRGGERIPRAVVARIAADVLAGLHAAHDLRDEAGELLHLVHRDVSPHNILVGVDGVSHITDFGIAKASVRLTSTREGQIKGKLAYMAPEQLTSDEVDRRTDVFTAGIVFWEMFTGRRLLNGVSEARIVHMLLQGELPRANAVASDIPDALDAVLMKALAREPDARWPTCEAFAEALAHAAPPADVAVVAALAAEAFAAPRPRPSKPPPSLNPAAPPSEIRRVAPVAEPPTADDAEPTSLVPDDESGDGPTTALPLPEAKPVSAPPADYDPWHTPPLSGEHARADDALSSPAIAAPDLAPPSADVFDPPPAPVSSRGRDFAVAAVVLAAALLGVAVVSSLRAPSSSPPRVPPVSVTVTPVSTVVEPIAPPPAPCLLYTSPSPRDRTRSRMPSSA